MTDAAVRAKPLNRNSRDALEVGLVIWQDNIDYLRGVVNDNPGLVAERLAERLAKLERAHAWLRAKLDSVEE